MDTNTHQSRIETTEPGEQGEVIRFLESGAGRGLNADRIDTHGAMIFLIGDEALKIKRAVKYDYMDLSTVAKRHALLDREFELNKTAAPSIYDGVIPIVRRDDGALALDGPGDVLEWVLKMNRFPAQDELTHFAKEHGIDDDLAQRLGMSIASYHAAAPVRFLDGATLIAEILDELARVFGSMDDAAVSKTAAIIARSTEVWMKRADELRERSRNGHVRRCHGDLHLRNIVMIDGVPTPFDALEFDERLGTCDTLYDIAFLLMDLDHLGMAHAANGVLNAYLISEANDISDAGLSLLPLYLSVRAAIRAMVDLQTVAVSSDTDDMMRDVRAYLGQALAYLDPASPLLVAIGGYSGTGKTTIARAIAHKVGAAPGAIHVRSDVVRKTLLHHDPLDRLGPEGYGAEVTSRTYQTIREQARQILAQGHSVILDAVHGDAAARQAAEDVASAAGCGFVGIWLEAPTETRTTRVASRGPDASDADANVVKRQADADPGTVGWHRVDTNQSMDAVMTDVLTALKPQSVIVKQNPGRANVG